MISEVFKFKRKKLLEMLFVLSKCLIRKASFVMFGFAGTEGAGACTSHCKLDSCFCMLS